MTSTSATGSARNVRLNTKVLQIIYFLMPDLSSKGTTIVGLVKRLNGVLLGSGVCKRSARLLLAHRLCRGAECTGSTSSYDTCSSIRIWIVLGHLRVRARCENQPTCTGIRRNEGRGTNLARSVAVASPLRAWGNREHVVIVVVVRSNGLGLCGGNSGGRGDISVELHCTASANAGSNEEEGKDESSNTRDGCKRSRRSAVSWVRCRDESSWGLDAPNVAPIAALFCRKPTPSPSLFPADVAELVGASTRVVIVTTPPSALVETTRER